MMQDLEGLKFWWRKYLATLWRLKKATRVMAIVLTLGREVI